MKTNNANTTTEARNNEVNYEISRFALNVGIVMAALIGIWGAACLISGLTANGVGGTVTAYLGAVLGM